MAKPRGVVEPSMVAVSVNEYVGDTSLAGYYEVRFGDAFFFCSALPHFLLLRGEELHSREREGEETRPSPKSSRVGC